MPGGWWLKYLSIAALVLLAGAFSPLHAASHLDALYSQVLKRPSDTALNLEFARAAEQAGVLRWALSAYERVVVNDPGNVEAQTGLQRVRRKLQPNFSQVTVELGAAVETNPRYYLGPKRTEFEGLASATWRDERALNDIRWRTVGVVHGLGYSKSGELNYGYAGLNTGPVIDLSGGWSVVPMVGGTAAYYDHNFYYGEGSFMTTFEKTSPNAFQSLQLRAAYRSYDDHFPSGEGAYYDARLRLGFPNVLGYRTIVIFTPWILYSDIAGSFESRSALVTDLQPGAYTEGGGKAEFYKAITDWMVFGASVSVAQRNYRNDPAPDNSGKRKDTLVIPGASLLFPNIFSFKTDLRFDYRYLANDSNDPTKTFADHVITASLIYRFDPTQNFWTQLASSRAR